MNDTFTNEPTLVERGGSQSDLRRYNERIVLSALDRHPGIFNAELARRTGLAAQTISVILRSLDKQGLIARGTVLRGRRGQPATPIYLRAEGAYGIGVSISWHSLSLCITDFAREVIDKEVWRHPFPDFDQTVTQIGQGVKRLLSQMSDEQRLRIAGVGVSMPYFIDQNIATIGGPESAAIAWRERDFIGELTETLGLPVWIVNDGSAASSAEADNDLSATGKDFGYMFVGTFLGGGIVLNGRPYAGPGGNAATIGSMIVPARAGHCTGADMVASLRGLQTVLTEGGQPDHGPIDADWAWQTAGAAVDTWLDDAAHVLAHVALNTHCVIDLDTLVIDGRLPTDMLATLVQRVSDVIARLPARAIRRPQIIQGRLGQSAPLIGAARVPLYQRFFALEAAG